ncbi:hypothetical protein HY989_02475 [Candidatus Micrarchaeota archaeon]|nr:hypothetical protein [Candidatus Micrarchaeota archaeon]
MAITDAIKELIVGSYSYVNKKGQRYFLHVGTGRGGTKLYFFSKDPKDSISLPSDRMVVESPRTALPIIKRKFKPQ